MRSLYLSQQGCALTLSHESILVKQGDEVLDEVQLPLLEQVLKYAGDNQTRAAQMLGLNRGTLRKKLGQYGIERPGGPL